MSKPQRPRSLKETEARAITRSIRVSPRKLNEVAASIRGKKVDKALAELTFSRRRIAGTIKKTLESAIANAENNHDLDINELVVAEAYVGKNIVMKRWTPRARGRVGRITKFFSELTIVVREIRPEAPVEEKEAA
jgi:large subunit ribosomal protein L22